MDDRGRLVLPREVREAVGLGAGSRLLVRLRSDGVIELVPFDRLYEKVTRVFRERLRGWREEEHEAYKLLEKLVAGRGDS